MVLLIEMVFFLLLVTPIPTAIHVKLFRDLRSPMATKIVRSMKYLFLFIFVLFIDSANRVYRVPDYDPSTMTDRNDILIKKFYSQRNLYLCGFTLFLSFILNRTFKLVKQSSDLKVQLYAADEKESMSLKAEDYKERLERKKTQYKALEEQSAALRKEYYRVCDELSELKGTKRSEERRKDE